MSSSLLQDILNALTVRDLRTRRQAQSGHRLTAATLKQECDHLLASGGEASNVSLARSAFSLFWSLPTDERRQFFHLLRDEFEPEQAAVEEAYARYHEDPSHTHLQALFQACEPPRQELMRRLNLAPGGTGELVRMRAEMLSLMKEDESLHTVDTDFVHLFSSWFNRGFLVLRRIDWSTSATILEKLIQYEAVHEIRDWRDLRRRLQVTDRRCFAFFHPALGDEPLIFVEVALTSDIPDSIQNILAGEGEEITADKATTAAFFGISNCQFGLRGISFGNFLIKQVVSELKQELPNLETFVSLSPVPGFHDWLKQPHGTSDDKRLQKSATEAVKQLEDPEWPEKPEKTDKLKNTLTSLVACYLTEARNGQGLPLNPVARFHLGNGARLHRINWLGDTSARGLSQAAGFMVNYVYDLEDIERNHERLANEGIIAASSSVRRLAKQIRA